MENIEVINFLKDFFQQIKKQILNEITTYCNKNCDQTRKMKITSVIDENHYIVRYNGKDYIAFSRYLHKLGETVYVTICCGNFNDLIII